MIATRWSILRSFISQYSWRFVITFMVAVLSSVATILLPLSIGKYYVLVFGFEGARADFFNFLPEFFFDTVPHFLCFFFALILIRLFAGFTQRYMIGSLGELLSHKVRGKLFTHQLGLDIRVYDEKGIGKYLLRYSGDLKSIQNYLTKGIIGFAADLLVITIALIALSWIDGTLAIICAIAIGVMVVPIALLNNKLHDISVIRRNRRSGLLAFVSQRLQRIASIKAFNKENPEIGKFDQRSDKLLSSGLAYHRLSGLIFVLVPALLYAMIGGIMYVIYQQKTQGVAINQGGLLAAFLLVITMLPVFRRVLRVMVTWKLGVISFNKLLNVINLPREANERTDDLAIEGASIVLDNVAYRFGKSTVFSSLNAQWQGGGIHLVLGGTGSGKSILVKLLLGLYKPAKGSILIDQQDLLEVRLKSLRKKVTIVSEEFPLFGKTVFEAISYSRKARKRKAAERMLRKVQAAWPAETHLKLDDRLGSEGNNLSKGQEKILLFTRALLTRKPILILDDPFGSIEPHIQQHLEQLLLGLKGKRTILVLMKREETELIKFDTVLNLDEHRAGRMVTMNKAAS